MTQGIRPDRVAESFKEVLATEIGRLKDPRVGFVTITAVDVTPDLRHARVYYTVLGEEPDHRSTSAGLRSASKHLRATLGRKVRLKFLPDLEFIEDDTVTRGNRIEQLLREVKPSDG
ncbi:MAG: 30S ribosome-binding factor RbfA [Actinobacteria bacterium]|nr:30S ribosome-binding factor RbfA [Actinomycetota bacterium]